MSPSQRRAPGSSVVGDAPSPRVVLRVVVIVVVSAIALYLLYLVRVQLGYVALAVFLAACAAGPVNVLSRRMRRGFAIAIVYLGIVLIPIAIAATLVPPLVRQVVRLTGNLPEYVADLQRAFDENEQLRALDENFDLSAKLADLSDELIGAVGDTAGALASFGAGLISTIFALVTILVLSMFMVASGRGWVDAALAYRSPQEGAAARRAIDRMSGAVSGYVGGALAQATVAGVTSFVVLAILGVPSPLPLAVVMALADLIPLVGATIGAVLVGVVTLFADFPTATIVWAIFAIAYQQFENYVVQPRIQSRAAELDPFVVVIAALFGGALLGVIGALLAIPTAAVLQVAAHEYLDFRRDVKREREGLPAGVGPPGVAPPGVAPPADPEPA